LGRQSGARHGPWVHFLLLEDIERFCLRLDGPIKQDYSLVYNRSYTNERLGQPSRERCDEQKLPSDELLGELVRNQLIYYPTVTRDPFRNRGRITDLIQSGQLFADMHLPPLDAQCDRVMICGSPALVRDSRGLLMARGFAEGNHGEPAQFVVEKAFAER
jgi:ferredoxin-NADP reductase